MKQKIVINVSMNGKKLHSRALKIAVSFSGVESASLGEKDKSQIVVIAEGVDPVEITTKLRTRTEKRKFVGYCLGNSTVHAELVSVTPMDGKKEEKKEEKIEVVPPFVWHGSNSSAPFVWGEVRNYDPYPCSIL